METQRVELTGPETGGTNESNRDGPAGAEKTQFTEGGHRAQKHVEVED